VTEVIGQPIYQRIAAALRAQISSGELAVGDALPSTRKLMQIHAASNNVVRNAVELLRHEGLVHGQPGKAVYVKAKPQDIKDELITVEGLREQVAALREEVRELAEQTNSSTSVGEMASEIAEVRSVVSLLQVHLRTLYDRVGQPHPGNEADPPGRRRKSS
jgi:DNA-binding GntR family transcriptional regulator